MGSNRAGDQHKKRLKRRRREERRLATKQKQAEAATHSSQPTMRTGR